MKADGWPSFPTSLTVIPRGSGNPQGGVDGKTTPTNIPLSLDGRGIKGEGERVFDTGIRGRQRSDSQGGSVIPRGSGDPQGGRNTVIADLIRNPEG